MGRKDREHWRHQEEMAAKADKVLDRASKKGQRKDLARCHSSIYFKNM